MFSKLKAIFKKTPKQRRYSKKIALFIFQNPDDCLNKKQLQKIFHYYEKWVHHAQQRSLSFEREVLYYISIRSFWSNIDDSHYVRKLLLYFSEVNVHFIDLILPGPRYFPQAVCSDYAVHLAEFFLIHANRSHLVISGFRITELLVIRPTQTLHPCEIAFASDSPELLLVLFRYGALTTDANFLAKYYLLKMVKELVRITLELNISGALNSSEVDNAKCNAVIKCGTIIMRVCPQFNQSLVFYKNSRILAGSGIESWKWVINNILPELEFLIFQPLPLKQVCKLKIRGILYRKWLLPDGIQKLPLPQYLKNYLDLLCD